MLIETAGLDDQQFWGLDQEIEQIERMAKVWEHQARMCPGGEKGDTIKRIAAGYLMHAELLRAARADRSPD